MEELPAATSTTWTSGPPANGTELTIRQAADRLGKSASTVRRLIKAGTLPAYKRPGPDGLEYRIPVAALGGAPTPAPSVPAGEDVAQLRLDLALARQEADLLRVERDRLRTEQGQLMSNLQEALSKIPRALEPAPAEPARRWFRRKRP